MIRIEIEVCEKAPGVVTVLSRALQGCQGEPTAGEDEVAAALFCMIKRESPNVGKQLGDCEEIKGEKLERFPEFRFIDDPQTKKESEVQS